MTTTIISLNHIVRLASILAGTALVVTGIAELVAIAFEWHSLTVGDDFKGPAGWDFIAVIILHHVFVAASGVAMIFAAKNNRRLPLTIALAMVATLFAESMAYIWFWAGGWLSTEYGFVQTGAPIGFLGHAGTLLPLGLLFALAWLTRVRHTQPTSGAPT